MSEIFCNKIGFTLQIAWVLLLSNHLCVQNSSVAHTVSCLMGTRVPSPGVKRPGREANHSPPSNAEVKNA